MRWGCRKGKAKNVGRVGEGKEGGREWGRNKVGKGR